MPCAIDLLSAAGHVFAADRQGADRQSAAAEAAAQELVAHWTDLAEPLDLLVHDVDAVCRMLQAWKLALVPQPCTRFRYLYRDGENNKQEAGVLFPGAIRPEEADRLFAACRDGQFFIPHQVELPDLQTRLHGFPTEDDYVWHELLDVETCTGPARALPDIHAFVAQFTATAWDEPAARKRLGLPDLPGAPDV